MEALYVTDPADNARYERLRRAVRDRRAVAAAVATLIYSMGHPGAARAVCTECVGVGVCDCMRCSALSLPVCIVCGGLGWRP